MDDVLVIPWNYNQPFYSKYIKKQIYLTHSILMLTKVYKLNLLQEPTLIKEEEKMEKPFVL